MYVTSSTQELIRIHNRYLTSSTQELIRMGAVKTSHCILLLFLINPRYPHFSSYRGSKALRNYLLKAVGERGTRFLKGMMNNFFILFFFTSFLILLFLSLSLSISSREPGFNLVLPYTQTSVSTSTMYQSTHVEPRLYAVLKSEFNQLPIFIEKFSPLPGFEPGTSLVPSRYATN